MRVAFDRPIYSPTECGAFFYNSDRKIQTWQDFTKVQNFTQSVEYYKPERIVQVPRRSSVRHRETLPGARETFPSVVRLIYRVNTTAHGIARRAYTLDEYGRALSPLWQSRPLGVGKRSARGQLPP